MRNTNRYNDCLGHDREGESGRIDESKSGQSRLIAETNGPPEEKTVEGKPPEAAQPPVESKPPEAAENSAAATTTRPLTPALYDWASRLTAEAGGTEEYYWTQQTERLVSKLKLTKRALIGVIGVQGAGKSAAMRAIAERLAGEEGFGRDHVVAVKVPESGGLVNALRSVFDYAGGPYREKFLTLMKEKTLNEFRHDPVFMQRARRLADRGDNYGMVIQVRDLPALGTHRKEEEEEEEEIRIPSWFKDLMPRRVIRELEAAALQSLIEEQRAILIDMPDYPKHDRRLIARDLDDIQGLWNRLMTSDSDVSIVVFIQKETFNHADHFLYGKMDLIDLMPLTVAQLLEAYKRKWGGYEPFTQDALEYIARMSRGVFRRFKRYIGLVLEMGMTQGAQVETGVDVKKAVTDEEIMRDMDKELDGIFKKSDQKQNVFKLIGRLAKSKAHGTNPNDASQIVEHAMKQEEVSKLLDISEMAASRLLRELEQHGYIRRFTRPRQMFGGEEKIVQLNW